MLQNIAIILIILIFVLLTLAALRPNRFRIERSITIDAAPEKIFALIEDLHQWDGWSPWEGIDPSLVKTYSGADSGPGSVFEWSGNKEVGRGRMEVIESTPPTGLVLKLDFIAPFEAHNEVAFTLEPRGTSTVVTQAMYGPSPFMSKFISLFFSMDKMVGNKYEQGLAKLKVLAQQ